MYLIGIFTKALVLSAIAYFLSFFLNRAKPPLNRFVFLFSYIALVFLVIDYFFKKN